MAAKPKGFPHDLLKMQATHSHTTAQPLWAAPPLLYRLVQGAPRQRVSQPTKKVFRNLKPIRSTGTTKHELFSRQI